MAQDQFINVTASAVKGPDGFFSHTTVHGSASSADLTISWDRSKFTTKQQLIDAFTQATRFLGTRAV